MVTKAARIKKQPETDGGYNSRFLGSNYLIALPKLSAKQRKDLLKFQKGKYRINYIHYSAVMCKSRTLAYFTSVNIDGTCWQDNSRKGTWNEDPRITMDDQLGDRLYNAENSKFDRGHLVRREDPEWGEKELSIKAGVHTFWFPNCAPQHEKLNQDIWADLEANILHTGADSQDLRVSVFTGPVLSDTDGTFVTQINGSDIKIPSLFWKVVVWKKNDKKVYAVGFIQSQEAFLIEDAIIKKPFLVNTKVLCLLKDDDIFEHLVFKDGKTYQVRLEEIEKLSGLKFDWPNVIRPFKNPQAVAIDGVRRKLPDPEIAPKVESKTTKSKRNGSGLKTKGAVCIPRWNPKFELEGLVI
ncbi:MAG: DNA/RNA non-specific endonuclease [Saprospiraceae bacterium]